MSAAPITIELMQTPYNQPVGRLLAQAFQGKFLNRSNRSEGNLAQCFHMLLDYFPAEPFSQRMVALQQGEVIGTISIKWKPAGNPLKTRRRLPLWRMFSLLGKWNMLKMLVGLSVLEHKPEAGECYIADLAVRSDRQSQGVGKLLLQWARHAVDIDPALERLSLHVCAGNPRAKQLYEKLSFHTTSRESRYILYVLFNKLKWDYMVLDKKGSTNRS